MNNMCINVMGILFCIVIIKIYINNLQRKYFYDKQYFFPFTSGLCLFLFFMIGSLLDFNGYIKFIIYFFPLWIISPTLLLYGLRRLMILKIKEEEYNDTVVKKFNIINSRMKTLYCLCFLSVALFIFVIVDSRLKF